MEPTSASTSSVREARLRPEFAGLYPGIELGVWFTAATLAEHLVRRLLRCAETGEAMPSRALDPSHFEFRGDGPALGARITLGGSEERR